MGSSGELSGETIPKLLVFCCCFVFYCILQLFFLEDKDHIILYWQANYLEEFPSIDLKILAIGVKNIGLHTMGFRFVFIYRDNQSYASDKFLTRPIGHSSFLHRN